MMQLLTIMQANCFGDRGKRFPWQFSNETEME